MDRRIILLSGPVASGKSMLGSRLSEQFKMQLLRTSDLVRSLITESNSPSRTALQRKGDDLDKQTHGRWVLDALSQAVCSTAMSTSIVVDSVKIQKQIDAIRDAYGSIVTHIHMTAPLHVLSSRYSGRRSTHYEPEPMNYETIRANATERSVDALAAVADVVIDSNRCTEEDVLVRVACHLRLYGEQCAGTVDVIVGGQYGSEGKGQIAAFLARYYDLLIRVGGPNAGHKVFEVPRPYTHHQLPSGTRRSTPSKLLIGPGAVLDVEKLLLEIAQCNVQPDRLKIDRNAMVIASQDIKDEQPLVDGIGSTGQGVGAATAAESPWAAFRHQARTRHPWARNLHVRRVRCVARSFPNKWARLSRRYSGHRPQSVSRQLSLCDFTRHHGFWVHRGGWNTPKQSPSSCYGVSHVPHQSGEPTWRHVRSNVTRDISESDIRALRNTAEGIGNH